MEVRTRIVPSPTGFFHVGNARTAIFNYLFTKKHNGALILRIEDTDKKRSEKRYEEDIIEELQWLGIEWDEGVGKGGPHQPYRQSEREHIYKPYLERLLGEGKAFWCPHTKEELEAESSRQRNVKEPPRHLCSARDEMRKEGGVIRLKTPAGEKICFTDVTHGEICFETDLLGDISIARDLYDALYNFAVVVDDHEMGITHVIRGEDHIPNTPKQILIERALGFGEPIWAHMALTLGKDRSKLSKRHGATALREYQEEGYLPEAMLNYLALLGWNPGDEREVISREELIGAFSLERLQKSGAIFDSEKLDWMNSQYIKKMFAENPNELLKQSKEFFPTNFQFPISNFQLLKILEIEKERIKKLSDLKESTQFFFEQPEYDSNLLRWKGEQDFADVKRHLEAVKKIIAEDGDVMVYADIHGKGEVLWPLRVALSGRKASPGPFEIMEVLGREETTARINHAISLFDQFIDKI